MRKKIFLLLALWPSFSIFCLPPIAPLFPDQAHDHFIKAEEFRKNGQNDKALEEYQKTLSVDPTHFRAQFNLSIEFFRRQEYDRAEEAFKKAQSLNPKCAQVYFNLGLICAAQSKLCEAREYFTRSIELNPTYAKAHLFLGSIANKEQKLDTALDHFKKAIILQPNNAEAHLHMAHLLQVKHDVHDALIHYRMACSLQPENIAALFDLAYLCNTQELYDEAIEQYQLILALEPKNPDALCNLAHTYRYKGLMEKAICYYQKVLDLQPNHVRSHCGLAKAYLAIGNFPKGLQEFEWRLKTGQDLGPFRQRLWDGSALEGKTILIRSEYGEENTLQFIRYAQKLKEMGARVILETQKGLVKLLALCPYLDQVIEKTRHPIDLPDFDVQVPIMSLPYIFKTTLKNIPCEVPYLETDPGLMQAWQKQIANNHNFKIGICFQKISSYEKYKYSHCKKETFIQTLLSRIQLQGVSYFNLEKEKKNERPSDPPLTMTMHEFGPNFDELHGNLMDSAALIKSLDLIITDDSTVAHLAGALGKDVWVVLPYNADWRWMQNRNTSPWYPTMHLFRQEKSGTWENVIQKIQEALSTRLHPSMTPTVMVELSIAELVEKIVLLRLQLEENNNKKTGSEYLDSLHAIYQNYSCHYDGLDELSRALYETCKHQLITEEKLREKEKTKTFDEEFIDLALSMYQSKNECTEIKSTINRLINPTTEEELL